MHWTIINSTHVNLGSHRPPCSWKKRGACFCPISSILRRMSRWASSTADFASVAASISFNSIAYVSFDHNLCATMNMSMFNRIWIRRTDRRDSFGSCSSSSGTNLGATLWPFFVTSNKTRFWPVWSYGTVGICYLVRVKIEYTLALLNSITWSHLPEISPTSEWLCRTRPARAL